MPSFIEGQNVAVEMYELNGYVRVYRSRSGKGRMLRTATIKAIGKGDLEGYLFISSPGFVVWVEKERCSMIPEGEHNV